MQCPAGRVGFTTFKRAFNSLFRVVFRVIAPLLYMAEAIYKVDVLQCVLFTSGYSSLFWNLQYNLSNGCSVRYAGLLVTAASRRVVVLTY